MLLQTFIALLFLALVSVAASLDNQDVGKGKTASPSSSTRGRGRGRGRQPGKQQRHPTKNPVQRAQGSQQRQPQNRPNRQRLPNVGNNYGATNLGRNPQNYYPRGSDADQSPLGTIQHPNLNNNLGSVFPYRRPSYAPQNSQGPQNNQLVPETFQEQRPNSGNIQMPGYPWNLRNSPIYVLYYPYPATLQPYQEIGLNQPLPYSSNALICAPDTQLPADFTKLKSSNPNISVRIVKSPKFGFPGGYMMPYAARQLCQSYFPTNGGSQVALVSAPGNVNSLWGQQEPTGSEGNTDPEAVNFIPSNDDKESLSYSQGYDPNDDVPYNTFSDENDPGSQAWWNQQNMPYTFNRRKISQSTVSSNNNGKNGPKL